MPEFQYTVRVAFVVTMSAEYKAAMEAQFRVGTRRPDDKYDCLQEDELLDIFKEKYPLAKVESRCVTIEPVIEGGVELDWDAE